MQQDELTVQMRQIDPDNVNAMFAAELNQMTYQEREKMYEELHGVEQVVQETDHVLETRLEEMDRALQDLPSRSIYEKAKSIDARYVEDRTFRLMFLRSEYYNAERAAVRLVNFLENKVLIFGEETLTRPIYMSDLNDDDMAVLKSGILQLIPVRDRSGRVVLIDVNMNPACDHHQPKDLSNYVRTQVALIRMQ